MIKYMKTNWRNQIHSDSDVLNGKPVIKGTRISVELILDLLSQGWTEIMILENYPTITKDSLRAVFSYLSECMKEELFFPPQKKVA